MTKLLFSETSFKLLLIALCIWALYYLIQKYQETKRPLHELIAREKAADLYEGYLRAVRAGLIRRVIRKEDIELVALSEKEFTLRMLELRSGNMTAVDVYLSRHGFGFRQTEFITKWEKTEDSGASITYEKIPYDHYPTAREGGQRIELEDVLNQIGTDRGGDGLGKYLNAG